MTASSSNPTAIFDFPAGRGTSPARRTFHAPSRILSASTIPDVVSALDDADHHARLGGWAVGLVSYEAAPAFDTALTVWPRGRLPLAWFALFDADCGATASPLQYIEESCEAPPVVASGPLAALTSTVSDAEYARSVGQIKEYIADGDVYQVNLTVPFTGVSRHTPLELYEHMRAAQRGSYSAYLDLGDIQIMSASPELFFDRTGNVVQCRPMKGTATRGLTTAADAAQRDALLHSEKDRAENVMIVDLVRNDLGKIARTGSVQVTSLHDAERYPTVWQLTSTIRADVSQEASLSAVFGALYPSGSITGAPKIRVTEIIRELERAPREAYCGAIGVLRPGGDATFNVAIRTAWTDDGGRTVHLNAGGAVTIDSTANGELAELRAKLSAFTTLRDVAGLFETFRVEAGIPQRLDCHLARLSDSAAYFGIPFDRETARELVRHTCAREHAERPRARGRLELHQTGALRLAINPFVPNDVTVPTSIGLAESAVDRHDVRLYHKSTDRRMYDEALAREPDCFDVLLWNSDDEVTEFTRGNLVAEFDGQLYTPPVACGLLGGVLRRELLDQGEITERVIHLAELQTTTRLWFINALRGWIPVAFPR